MFFSLNEFDQTVYDGMTDYYKEQIAQSDEYKAMFSKKARPAAVNDERVAVVTDDDIPF